MSLFERESEGNIWSRLHIGNIQTAIATPVTIAIAITIAIATPVTIAITVTIAIASILQRQWCLCDVSRRQ